VADILAFAPRPRPLSQRYDLHERGAVIVLTYARRTLLADVLRFAMGKLAGRYDWRQMRALCTTESGVFVVKVWVPVEKNQTAEVMA
jgi:hypothetical protein